MYDPITIIIVLLIGTSCLVGFFKYQEKRKRIIQNGIEVDGVVYEYDDVSINGQDNYPVIRFVTKEGLWITEQTDYALSKSLLKEGQKVKVIYNSENPKEFIYKTSIDLSKIGYLVFVIGIVAILIGLWFAYKYLTSEN